MSCPQILVSGSVSVGANFGWVGLDSRNHAWHLELENMNLNLAFAICFLWPLVSYFISLSLSFLIYKMGIKIYLWHLTVLLGDTNEITYVRALKTIKNHTNTHYSSRGLFFPNPQSGLLLNILFKIIAGSQEVITIVQSTMYPAPYFPNGDI